MSHASPPVRRLALEGVSRSRHQLHLRFRVDDLCFASTYWYESVDLPALEERYGQEALHRIYFHVAAFEGAKLLSLDVRELDFGPLARFCTPAFERLFRAVFRGVWGQWRFENDLPDDRGPAFVHAPSGGDAPDPPRIGARGDAAEVLLFCGGGKDSLVAMKLLEGAGVRYASLAYAHSIYGAGAPQHSIIDALLDHGAPVVRHRQWILEDFLDAPAPALHAEYGVRSVAAAETPCSLFGALPVVLAHGYRAVALAHERSADAGNLVWPRTGEVVNHQWAKSREAEVLLGDYLRREVVGGVAYFSVLSPVHDLVIFQLLAGDLSAVAATHSCNVRKPWCRRCPKCAYVWLGYRAFLPRPLVDGIFGADLVELPENLPWFRQMLGLEAHKPFECIGEVDEARLLFAVCVRRGLDGPTARALHAELEPLDLDAVLDRYLPVDAPGPAFPPAIAAGVLPRMREAARAARAVLRTGSQASRSRHARLG